MKWIQFKAENDLYFLLILGIYSTKIAIFLMITRKPYFLDSLYRV